MVSATEGWAPAAADLSGSSCLDDRSAVDGGSVYHTADGVRWEEQLQREPGLLYAVSTSPTRRNGWTVGDGGRHQAHVGRRRDVERSSPVATRRTLSVRRRRIGDGARGPAGWMVARTGTSPVLLRTTDAGVTWPRGHRAVRLLLVRHGLPRAPIRGWLAGVALDVAAQTATPEVLHTVDGGATWRTRSLDRSCLRERVSQWPWTSRTAEHGWIAGTGRDGRESRRSSPRATAATPGRSSRTPIGVRRRLHRHGSTSSSPLEGWASGEALYHTTDGGVTWTRQVAGIAGGLLAIAAADPTHVGPAAAGCSRPSTPQGDTAGAGDAERRRGRLERASAVAIAPVGRGRRRLRRLASTEYRVDGGAWTPGLAPPEFPAPADHSGDGSSRGGLPLDRHAPATSSPCRSCACDIDTVRPVIRLGRCTVGRDDVLRLRAAHRRRAAAGRSTRFSHLTVRDRKGRFLGNCVLLGR